MVHDPAAAMLSIAAAGLALNAVAWALGLAFAAVMIVRDRRTGREYPDRPPRS